jgi:hypothetical protein
MSEDLQPSSSQLLWIVDSWMRPRAGYAAVPGTGPKAARATATNAATAGEG